jgi:hypothetical protein
MANAPLPACPVHWLAVVAAAIELVSRGGVLASSIGQHFNPRHVHGQLALAPRSVGQRIRFFHGFNKHLGNRRIVLGAEVEVVGSVYVLITMPGDVAC